MQICHLAPRWYSEYRTPLSGNPECKSSLYRVWKSIKGQVVWNLLADASKAYDRESDAAIQISSLTDWESLTYHPILLRAHKILMSDKCSAMMRNVSCHTSQSQQSNLRIALRIPRPSIAFVCRCRVRAPPGAMSCRWGLTWRYMINRCHLCTSWEAVPVKVFVLNACAGPKNPVME